MYLHGGTNLNLPAGRNLLYTYPVLFMPPSLASAGGSPCTSSVFVLGTSSVNAPINKDIYDQYQSSDSVGHVGCFINRSGFGAVLEA